MADEAAGQGEWALREMQQRVRTMGGVIRCVARRTVETSRSLEDFQARFDGRLGALVRAHAAMSRSAAGEASLEEIVRDTLQEHAPAASNWSVDGPEVRLPVALTDPLALLLHELAVEAVADGALGHASGRLAVDWTVDGDEAGGRRLLLGWRETGLLERRPPADFDFARVLLDYMAPRGADPEAEETASDGLRLSLRLPLSEAEA